MGCGCMGLRASSEAALDCLGVQGSDVVAVAFNDEQRAIADALAEAANRRARAVRLLEFAPTSRHGEEAPTDVVEAMLAADVVFAPTSKSLSHTRARQSATRRGARIATLPMITEDIFVRTLPIDYSELSRISQSVAARLTGRPTRTSHHRREPTSS
jgi:leucyl aminopeptidase (aminopeptidase T)